MKSGILDDSVLFAEVIREMRRCHQKNKHNNIEEKMSPDNLFFMDRAGNNPENSFSNNIQHDIAPTKNKCNNNNYELNYNYLPYHNNHIRHTQDMDIGDLSYPHIKRNNEYDQTILKNEIDQQEDDDMSFCSTEEITRNSQRSSVIEDSDSISFLDRRSFSTGPFCEIKRLSLLSDQNVRVGSNNLYNESTTSYFDRKKKDSLTYEPLQPNVSPNDLYSKKTIYGRRNSNNVQNISGHRNLFPSNNYCHTYNSPYIQKRHDYNEDMKKYFHKITSIRKKIFICEYCSSKFVYKKCLDNHLEKNH